MRALALLLCTFSLPATAADLLLNSSPAEQFTSVDGVDIALANRIVDLRQQRGGSLSSIESLRTLNIPAATLDNLRSQVGVDLPLVKVANEKRQFNSADEVLAEFKGEPDIRAVQAMAMASAHSPAGAIDVLQISSKQADDALDSLLAQQVARIASATASAAATAPTKGTPTAAPATRTTPQASAESERKAA